MQKHAGAMEWLRNWSWRLAILALPWQTRYIVAIVPTPEAGYQTEWGMFAFYASWMAILAAWILSLGLQAGQLRVTRFGWLLAGLFLLPVVLQPTWYALQWAGQLLIIALLIDALRRYQVSRTELASWFLVSLIPHVLIAVWQFDSQFVTANKWLGISVQDPALPGVSVTGPNRTLRAYAGFPHPNIAGMWFVFGIAAALWLVRQTSIRWQIVLAWLMSAVLPIALILTFSRTAWISALIVLACLLVSIVRRPVDVYTLRAVTLSIVCAAIAALPVWSLIGHRAASNTALETRSIDERAAAWKGIWPVIVDSPIIGYGIGQSLQVMQKNGLGNQPPHAVPLIVLLENGILGFVAIFISIGIFWFYGSWSDRVLLAVLAPPFFTDHYLWSLWGGQLLAGFCIIWLLARHKTIDKKIKI